MIISEIVLEDIMHKIDSVDNDAVILKFVVFKRREAAIKLKP